MTLIPYIKMEIVSSFSEVKKHLLLKKVSYDWILFVDIEKNLPKIIFMLAKKYKI